MGYQPYYTGQTFSIWQLPLNTDSGADDLYGVDLTKMKMIFRPSGATPTDIIGTGTFSLITAYPAVVAYKPSTSDVANAFTGSLIITALLPPSSTSTDEVVYDPIPFTITAI